MATGVNNLPYPGKVYTPFDILTAEELNEDVANIESLATGTGIGDGAIATAALSNAAVTAPKIDFTTFIQNGITWLTGTGSAFIPDGSVTFPRAVPISSIKDITLTNIGYKNSNPTGIGDTGLTIWESPQIGIKLTISGGNVTGFTYTIGVPAGTIPSGRRIVFAWSVIG